MDETKKEALSEEKLKDVSGGNMPTSCNDCQYDSCVHRGGHKACIYPNRTW